MTYCRSYLLLLESELAVDTSGAGARDANFETKIRHSPHVNDVITKLPNLRPSIHLPLIQIQQESCYQQELLFVQRELLPFPLFQYRLPDSTMRKIRPPSAFIRLNDCDVLIKADPPKLIDHYTRPRNVGSLDRKDPSVGSGLVGAPAW